MHLCFADLNCVVEYGSLGSSSLNRTLGGFDRLAQLVIGVCQQVNCFKYYIEEVDGNSYRCVICLSRLDENHLRI